MPELIEHDGGRHMRTRVGHSFIKAAMAAEGAVFGGGQDSPQSELGRDYESYTSKAEPFLRLSAEAVDAVTMADIRYAVLEHDFITPY